MQASLARYEEGQGAFFAWLLVAPLTEGQLLQRVLLPNFDAVPQKTVLDRVLQAGAWKTEAELRTALAAISFVPRGMWHLPTQQLCHVSAIKSRCSWMYGCAADVFTLHYTGHIRPMDVLAPALLLEVHRSR